MESSSENASPKKFQSKRSMRRGGAAGADGSSSSDGGNGDGASLVPIVNIADLVSGQQKMQVRVLSKSIILEFSSSKTFSCVIYDGTGLVRLVVWGDELCQTFNKELNVGETYVVEGFLLKRSTHLLYTWIKNGVTVHLNRLSRVTPSKLDLPDYLFKFARFSELTKPGDIVDVVGLVDLVGEVKPVNAQSGNGEKKSFKREITLLNELNESVILTIWNGTAEKFILEVSQHENPIAAFGGVRVSTYERKDKSTVFLDTFDDIIIKVNPDLPEVEAIRVWSLEE